MDQKTKEILKKWLPPTIVFLIIACVCVQFIFAPVEIHNKYKDGTEERIGSGFLYLQGAKLIVESWKEFPRYTIGLGISAYFAFCGAAFCIYNLHKASQE
ncbi:MAG: hypothetical protein PHI12_12320 [Dehalococcoidales bacterium]|jgi:hypothetical protein|nr:hypothetical protein [Dehalococcoidales bacterium]